MTKRRTLMFFASLIGFGLLATACSQQNEGLDDAPIGVVDDSPAKVFTNADQFPNVAFRCIGVNGIYTTTRNYGDAITVVANDPECGGDPNFTAVSG